MISVFACNLILNMLLCDNVCMVSVVNSTALPFPWMSSEAPEEQNPGDRWQSIPDIMTSSRTAITNAHVKRGDYWQRPPL